MTWWGSLRDATQPAHISLWLRPYTVSRDQQTD